ncbi:polysaccharide biosynthesis/export family protein [Flavobacterium piscinae]|uniref:Sugar transporter n=2 Tax=Flavobacterium piscinae TaxID=2506424 RepID=A0A4Q1KFJ6_9FLAO|nr:polysaccharide biosynthesis/export family protein [Flavobacterium piscinae]MBC8883002.1 polysaccharide biosynthesis/export family protein [Flavobacterium piscinae]RXR27744.1 sugar transporter [Flavobacterium piscinae]
MNKTLMVIVMFIVLVTSSCVPTKDLKYLQSNHEQKDTLVMSQLVKKPYRIQSNDILVINIKTIDATLTEMFQVSDGNRNIVNEQIIYFEGFNVDDHGNIRIPILGEVAVLGKTTEEIRLNIEKRLLEEYFNEEAELFITVKLAGIRYTINGEIKSPGTNIIYNERATIMDAISNSGDILITGDRKEVIIVRQYPHGVEMHTVNLLDRKAIESPYYYLQPNDFILINPLKQKSWGTGTTGIQTMTTIITALSLVTSIILLSRL